MATENIDPFVVLTIVGGLALAVERMIEAIKHIIDSQTPATKMEVLQQVTELVQQSMQQARDAVDRAKQGLPVDNPPPESIPSQDEEEDTARKPVMQIEGIQILPAIPKSEDKARRLLCYQLFAAGLGIFFASLFNVHLFHDFVHGAFDPAVDAFLRDWRLLDEMMTGLLIGGVSQPVHLVIGYLTQRRNAR